MKTLTRLTTAVTILLSAGYAQISFEGYHVSTITISWSGLNSGTQAFRAADIDGDGDTDLMSTSMTKDNIIWYKNDGKARPSFTAHAVTDGDSYSSGYSFINADVHASDIDGDGDMDLVAATWNSKKVIWYQNDGSQSFTAKTIDEDSPKAVSVYPVDLDGDSDVDLLTASWAAGNKFVWYKNDGSENFTAQTITTTDSDYMAVFVSAADVDGDGDMDVLTASTNYSTGATDKISWHENDGSQNFTERVIDSDTDTYRSTSLLMVDMDGDGDKDFLSFSENDNDVVWYRNDGSQNFTAVAVGTAANPLSVAAVDLDNDGDMDVLSGSYVSGSDIDGILWYENNGMSFTANTVSSPATSASFISVADVDGDGDSDILSASYRDGKLVWLQNSLIDKVPPIVTSVTSTTSNATYGIGSEVNVTVNFNEAVTLSSGGTLTVNLETGDTDRAVTITSISNASSATGTYTVQSGDVSGDLTVNSISLSSGATLKDAAGNAMSDFSIPSGSNLSDAKAIVIEGVPPSITSVSSSTVAGTYGPGKNIYIVVNFSEAVTLSSGGTLTVNLETGDTDRTASITAISSATAGSGKYVVQAGDVSSSLTANSVSLSSGATLTDAIGNAMSDFTIPSTGTTIGGYGGGTIIVDGIAPAVSIEPADGSTNIPVSSNITLTFSEPIRKGDGATLDDNSVDGIVKLQFTDANGELVPHEASINETKTVITLDPTSDFPSEKTLYVSIAAGDLEDERGNDLAAVSTTFITEDIIPPSPFDLVYPFDSSTITLTRDNFLDTLYFAWNQSVDAGGDVVTYKREMTGDLPEYIRFIVPRDGTHEIESYALSFDGVDDYVRIATDPDLPLGNSPRTVSVWIFDKGSGDGAGSILHWGDGDCNGKMWGVGKSNGKLALWGGCKDWVTNLSIPQNEWTFVSATYDGAKLRAWVNDTKDSTTTSGEYQTTTSDFFIGGETTNNGSSFRNHFTGIIDEVSVWDKALNDGEVALISEGYAHESDLVGQWNFNEGSGTTVTDATENGNDGEIYGATWGEGIPADITNMFKIPYHHIEHYMHEAKVEIISGHWDIVATDGKFNVPSANGPFKLTIDGSQLNIGGGGAVPETFALHPNFPNPFNPSTTISYDLPEQAGVTLAIYDILGVQIRTLIHQSQDAGNKTVVWDGRDNLGRQVSAGVYLYRIEAGAFIQTRKMLLLK